MVNDNSSGVQIASRHSWLQLVEWIIQVHGYKYSDGTFINVVLRLQKFQVFGFEVSAQIEVAPQGVYLF